jgi:hypothetical protein
LEEYEDSAQVCSDCNKPLVSLEQIEKSPGFHRVREDEDTTNFVIAADAEDPFEADAFTAAVGEAGIPVLATTRQSSAVDALTSGVQRSWWEIRVPQELREKAAGIIATRRAEMKAAEADAEQAAEEEAEASSK